MIIIMFWADNGTVLLMVEIVTIVDNEVNSSAKT